MTPLAQPTLAPDDPMTDAAAVDRRGFVDCRGVWQPLEVEEPDDAGS